MTIASALILAAQLAGEVDVPSATGAGGLSVSVAAGDFVPGRDLISLRRLSARTGRGCEREAGTPDAAAVAEWSFVASAVLDAEVSDPCVPRARPRRDAFQRDMTAYQLLAVGYSPREAADIAGGRIPRSVLDHARRLLMVGGDPDDVANFVDARYRAHSGHRPAEDAGTDTRPAGPSAPATPTPRGLPAPLSQVVVRAAASFGVDVGLVRAVMAVESGYDPEARSPAGAIGLMQLMPPTARALGVDPYRPGENILGGVRYLAQLLAQFGDLDSALVAYNGGPGYALRYRRGEAPLYGETRRYLQRVRTMLGR